MTVLVYLTSASFECYSQSTDVVIKTKLTIDRTSWLEVYYQKGVTGNLAKFTGRLLTRSHFLVKFKTPTCNFVKKRLAQVCFIVNFEKVSRAPIQLNICRHLLLYRKLIFSQQTYFLLQL